MSGEKKFKIGDLVLFNSSSPSVSRNQVGIIINTDVMSAFQEECFINKNWYVAIFGSMRLVVSSDMITRLGTDYE